MMVLCHGRLEVGMTRRLRGRLRIHSIRADKVNAADGSVDISLPDVQRAASEAVAEFQRRGSTAATATATSGDAASTAPPSSSPVLSPNDDNASSASTPAVAAALDHGDMFGGMRTDLYFASLAQGLLIEPPPPPTTAEGFCDDEGCGGAEMELWS
ncbi:hypothetical protein OsJ_28162 [Oryza sativa Japonica Group]|uniref:Uncharacterized protein n=1 Tax=Oryza sativa subsp. japonica TaxID=39947 RepID=B9FYE6_ORYSJ|nr:hypothetical protein OsJ_28162 [Oryza sativa Japonica Group]